MYGVYSRRYFAFAAWQGCEAMVIEAGTAEELEHLMAEAELEAARRDAASTARLASLLRRLTQEAA